MAAKRNKFLSLPLIPLLAAVFFLSVFIIGSFGSSSRTAVLSQGSDSGPSDSEDRSGPSEGESDDEDEPDDEDIEDEDIETPLQDQVDLRRRVEVRQEDDRIRVRVRIGNTTREIEIRPDETRARFKVEENGIENKVTIRVRGDRFVITHEGIEAQTRFPLTIDPTTNTLMVNTPAGLVNVVTLPGTAIQNMLATGKFDQATETEIDENDDVETADENKLVFKVRGINNLKLFGFIPISVPVTSEVGAQTGEVLSTQEPLLIQIFRFLFSE